MADAMEHDLWGWYVDEEYRDKQCTDGELDLWFLAEESEGLDLKKLLATALSEDTIDQKPGPERPLSKGRYKAELSSSSPYV